MAGGGSVLRAVGLPHYRHSAGFQREPALLPEFLWPARPPDSSALFSMYRGDGLLLSRQRLVFPVEPGVLSEHGRPAGRRRTARARSVLVARRGGGVFFDVGVGGPHAYTACAGVDV